MITILCPLTSMISYQIIPVKGPGIAVEGKIDENDRDYAQFYQTLEQNVANPTAQLAAANQKITKLNERLKAENMRMSAELEMTQKLQQMVLSKRSDGGIWERKKYMMILLCWC